MNQPFSYIHPSAEIADNVVIEPFVTISKDVVIGEGTWIGPHVTIMEGARIGKNCKIFPGAVISAIPQDLKYKGEKAIVEIGNNVTIREYVTVNKGTEAAMKTVIGDNSVGIATKGVTGNVEFDEKGDIKNGALTLMTYKGGARTTLAVIR